MGGMMAIIMLAFMLGMYSNKRANLEDPRVQALAQAIIEAQVSEIDEMQFYINDITQNGIAPEGTPRATGQ